jgi:hypothetical protein
MDNVVVNVTENPLAVAVTAIVAPLPEVVVVTVSNPPAGVDGREVLLQKSATHIQWQYSGAASWTNLVALADLMGTDGREIELRVTATYIQWRYVGGTWTNLIALTALKGDKGDTGVGISDLTYKVRGLISNPQAIFGQRPQIPLFRADANLIVTRIFIKGSNPTPEVELACDLKWADDINIGGFANATVIDVCDTTSGQFLATSGLDDASIAADKWVYLQLDSLPHTDWKDFYIEVFFVYA